VTCRCARCDSTDDDGADIDTPSLSQQPIDFPGHTPEHHPLPVGTDCFRPRLLDVASNSLLINVNDDESVTR